jgi:transposase
MSTGLAVPLSITIIALPPKSPELNPVENVWQFLRDNWLSNRVFKSSDDLVDRCDASLRLPKRFSEALTQGCCHNPSLAVVLPMSNPHRFGT